MRKELLILITLFFLLLIGTLLMHNLIKLSNSDGTVETTQKRSFITSYAVQEEPVYEDQINFAKSCSRCKN